MILGSVLLLSAGILFMSLKVPSYAQVKAFYGFRALVPFSALVAVGWNWLSRKHPALRTVLWVFLLVWTMGVTQLFGFVATTRKPVGFAVLIKSCNTILPRPSPVYCKRVATQS